IVFRLDGYTGYAHEREAIKNAWENMPGEKGGQVVAQCLATGKMANIQETHTKIKGVIGISSDSALVAINSPATNAYDSYGKSKAFNAPVSEEAVFKYTTALNYLLSSPSTHMQIGDATTVFWAESPGKVYAELAGFLLSPPASNNTDGEKRDRSTERLIKDVLDCVRDGRRISDISNEINEETRFYILGLSPNAGRIAIRYFYVNSFGNFIKNISQHYRDMELREEQKFIPVWQLLNETVPKKSKDKKVPPLLGGQIMRSIITGAPYPYTIYSNIIGRIRAEQDDRDRGIYSINSTRASIIKAYLLRSARILKNKSYGEVLTMSLNEKSQNNAYLLGRLFALLEKAQENAAEGKLNSTIKDRYFSTASASPGLVFPTLLRLSQHHIEKSDRNRWVEIKMGEIMDGLNTFPAHLNIEEQGVFILGYYHQREAFFRKNTEQVEN
ncbi:MAG: type I-C CRISPR-associated protein Cas8c/Csd1, partial [Caulobacteraceae bacterium]